MAVIGLALMAALCGEGLVIRYDWRRAAGDIDPPSLRVLSDDDSAQAVGAEIADAPDGVRSQTFLAALKTAAPALPWSHGLLRRKSGVGQTVFIPAGSMAEAFAICASLPDVPLHCAPAVASEVELRTPDGGSVSASTFAQMGIAPYTPMASRAKVALIPEALSKS